MNGEGPVMRAGVNIVPLATARQLPASWMSINEQIAQDRGDNGMGLKKLSKDYYCSNDVKKNLVLYQNQIIFTEF